MTHPKDMDEQATESRSDEAELMLVELLYGELEDSEQEQAMEQVRERGLSSELDGFERLRAMLAELPEEEPSAAVTAKLMHAAATNVPGAAGRTRDENAGEEKGILGWLSSLIRPIAMYPGLAAATTLVLVVGVAGTLYLSGRDQLATPRLPAAEPVATPGVSMEAPAPAPAEEAEAMDESLEAMDGAGEGRGELAQDVMVPQAGDGRGAGPGAEGQAGEMQAARRSSRASATSKASKKREASAYEGKELDQVLGGGATGANVPRSAAPAKDSRSFADEAPAADTEAELDDDGRYEAPAEPAPRQRAAPRREDSAGASADKSKAAPVSAPVSKQEGSRVRSLHDEAKIAAANGQCDVVRKVAGMIRKLDERYYQDSYLKDSALRACLSKK